MSRLVTALSALAILGTLAPVGGCDSGPDTPQPPTPAFAGPIEELARYHFSFSWVGARAETSFFAAP